MRIIIYFYDYSAKNCQSINCSNSNTISEVHLIPEIWLHIFNIKSLNFKATKMKKNNYLIVWNKFGIAIFTFLHWLLKLLSKVQLILQTQTNLRQLFKVISSRVLCFLHNFNELVYWLHPFVYTENHLFLYRISKYREISFSSEQALTWIGFKSILLRI